MRRIQVGKTQRKILLLLQAGLVMGLSPSPKVHIRVMRELTYDWKKINRTSLTRAVESLYQTKLVKKSKHKDGTVTLVLTDEGEKNVIRYNINSLKIKKPKQWDNKWRVVMYDIPEDLRKLRIELLGKLKKMGFVELQHSVFVHPYECKNEIEFLIEVYDARRYIRRMVVDEIDITEPLLKHFNLYNKKK